MQIVGNVKQSIEKRRLSDDVRDKFEQMILSGEFAPGDAFPSERDLMERFGVGRPAIREALFALQRMGLLSQASGTRARVTTPSADRMILELSSAAKYFLAAEGGERAFQEARLFFESALARQAAYRATDADISVLKSALAANANANEKRDVENFQRTDVAFHLQIALICGNPIFKAIHDAIEAWLVKQRTLSLMVPGAMQNAYEHHQKIYEAIAARNADLAETEMKRHLESVSDYYWMTKRNLGRQD